MAEEQLRLDAVDRRPNLYEVVSDRLLAAIRQAGLTPGSKIPSERELGEQFGVSRTVVREAIRHLAAKGILEARSGSGVRVANIGHDGVSESIEIFLTRNGPVDPEKVNEVRQCIELQTVAYAAERATEEQLGTIRAECEKLAGLEGHSEEASLADVAFHRAIAEASGNELFLVLVDSLAEVMLDIRRATLRDPGRTAVTLQQHRRIAEELEARNSGVAVEAMREHLIDSLAALRHALEQAAAAGNR
ncbi:MAG TPA: FadR/GntR family transcriptional regulator [Propionibacteriaceae bacterium]|nr:FadR/GntR family transcriptional regulator [Propionibacteriaceae bacterium]